MSLSTKTIYASCPLSVVAKLTALVVWHWLAMQGFMGRSKNCYTIAARAAEKAMQNMCAQHPHI